MLMKMKITIGEYIKLVKEYPNKTAKELNEIYEKNYCKIKGEDNVKNS